jgi:hypothetical protein
MARNQAEKLCREFPRHHIEANYEYCLQQKRAGAIKKTTGGFLRSAILTNFAKAPARPPVLEAPAAAPAPASAGTSDPMESQREMFRKLPLAARRSVLEECLRGISATARSLLPRDLDSSKVDEAQLLEPRVEATILAWLARRTA